jgi:regulator of protease activity HflC (stomatin/prohibitin superfamily)
MNKITINTGKVGLVMRNDEFQSVLTAGTYRFWRNTEVDLYDLSEAFEPALDLKKLLKNSALANKLFTVTVKENNVALLYADNKFVDVLTEGLYAYWNEDIKYHIENAFMNEALKVGDYLNTMLKNEKLAEMLHVIDVKDDEIAMLYADGIFKSVLNTGKYAYWKGFINYTWIVSDLTEMEIPDNIDTNTLLRAEVAKYVRAYTVESYEKGLLFVEGELKEEIDTGIHYFWKNATPISVLKADMRQQRLELAGQEILTKDKAALRVNFTTQYKVIDIQKALVENKDYVAQLYILTQLHLRSFIGSMTLDELLEKKDESTPMVLDTLKAKALHLGVEVTDCGIKDVILPGEVKEIMNQVLVAQKKAQANTITRREETAATRSLLNTAKLMEDNQMLYKLKEMEYVEKIADKINSISLSGGTQVVDQLRDIFTS